MSALAGAVREWRDVVGDSHVSTDPSVLAAMGTTTYATEQAVTAVVHPGSRDEVRECLRIAARHHVPVYPVSTGKNWGYGSTVPPRDGCALLGLGRLNRIVDFDEDLAYVTVEPGVTQADLHAFLRSRRSRLRPSVTGSSPDSSLVGNVVERGLGEGLYGDRFSHVCGMEVVIPTGEVLRMGFTRYAGARTGPLHRWGVGPWLDGLFTQSNLGVVTRMTLWLAPRARNFLSFRFAAAETDLGALADAVRELRLAGVLGSGFVIANDVRALSGHQQYPRDLCGNQTPLPESARRKLREHWGLSAWNGEGSLHAVDAAHGRALREVVSRFLGPHTESLSFEAGERDTIQCGVPVEDHLAMAYWRKPAPRPERDLDPDRDRCGLIWITPVVPMTGRDVVAAVATIERTSTEFGFEPNIGLNLVSERTATVTTALVYDRDEPGQDDRARACHRRMSSQLVAQGYPPYRYTAHSAPELTATDDSASVIARLKSAVDPIGVLAPGRYELLSPNEYASHPTR
ncbi:FAD-binding oxidoreductase [Saccharopolyspora taberi]|uniref:FAD-binding oxidoreductase n=1 Tax=Saccharopolyspora taberi TaxID=60895 RepID=A0ABN3VH01_9PSEU